MHISSIHIIRLSLSTQSTAHLQAIVDMSFDPLVVTVKKNKTVKISLDELLYLFMIMMRHVKALDDLLNHSCSQDFPPIPQLIKFTHIPTVCMRTTYHTIHKVFHPSTHPALSQLLYLAKPSTIRQSYTDAYQQAHEGASCCRERKGG